MGWVADGDLDRIDGNAYSAQDQAAALPLLREELVMSRDPEHWPYADLPWEVYEAEMWACEVGKYVRLRDRGMPPRERYRPPTPETALLF